MLGAAQGLPYPEVALILEIPVGTVKSRMFQAVRLLRTDLEQLGELFSNAWSPVARTGKPAQNISAVMGNRFAHGYRALRRELPSRFSPS